MGTCIKECSIIGRLDELDRKDTNSRVLSLASVPFPLTIPPSNESVDRKVLELSLSSNDWNNTEQIAEQHTPLLSPPPSSLQQLNDSASLLLLPSIKITPSLLSIQDKSLLNNNKLLNVINNNKTKYRNMEKKKSKF